MWEPRKIRYNSKVDFYRELALEFEGMRDSSFIANCANLSALLYFHLPDVNWVGFYLMDRNELVLGPFQGYPACVRIPLGKGVCGTAALQKTALRIADVHQFPGHITCDARSKSEIVLPLDVDGEIIGVLDIDSQIQNRFDEADEDGIKSLTSILLRD